MATKKKLKNFAAFYIETGEKVEMFIEDNSDLIVESEQDSSTVKTIDNPKEKEKSKQEHHEESCKNIR